MKTLALAGTLVLVGCAGTASHHDASPVPPPSSPAPSSSLPSSQPREHPPFVVDGLVLWSEPIDRAPERVRAMWSFTADMLAALDGAPLPPVRVRDIASDEDRARFAAWQRDVQLPYWAEARARLEPRSLALAAARERAYAEIPAFALFETLTSLLVAEHAIRGLDAAGYEPVVGGCSGPEVELGDLLGDCRDHAQRCVRLAADATDAMRENLAPCALRAQTCGARHDAAQQDICEVDYPER